MRLSGAAVCAAGVVYFVVGYGGYVRFGEALHGDILIDLALVPGGAIKLVRLGFGISLCLTCRAS